MDKLEAIQKILRFNDECGYGSLADEIIEKGIKEGFLDEDDLD